jgi:hypothetical protein
MPEAKIPERASSGSSLRVNRALRLTALITGFHRVRVRRGRPVTFSSGRTWLDIE